MHQTSLILILQKRLKKKRIYSISKRTVNLVLVGLFGAISVGFRSQFCSVNDKNFGVGSFEDGWLMVV